MESEDAAWDQGALREPRSSALGGVRGLNPSLIRTIHDSMSSRRAASSKSGLTVPSVRNRLQATADAGSSSRSRSSSSHASASSSSAWARTGELPATAAVHSQTSDQRGRVAPALHANVAPSVRQHLRDDVGVALVSESVDDVPVLPERAHPEHSDRQACDEKRQYDRRVDRGHCERCGESQGAESELIPLLVAQLEEARLGFVDRARVHVCRFRDRGQAGVRGSADAYAGFSALRLPI